MVKIAVTGPRGRLGSELVRQGCIPIRANILNYSELRNEILDINPDVVINCAAYSNVDGCESSPRTAYESNVHGVFTLAQVFPGKIVHISTDYIFDGKDGPYDETAKPNPISIYGWSKLGGEIALKNRGNADDLIVRTTILFDKYSRNFVTAVMKRLAAGETVNVPNNLVGTPTYIPHLAEGILRAIEQGMAGVLHIAGGEGMSRYDLACYIAAVLGVPLMQVQEGPITGAAPRPLRAGLIVGKAFINGIPIYHPSDGIKEIVNALETVEAG